MAYAARLPRNRHPIRRRPTLRARVHRALKAVHHALPEWLKQPLRPLYLRLFYFPLFPEMSSRILEAFPGPATGAGDDAPGPAILCLPSIPWYFRTQRPQHLLTGLVARGWRALYMDPRLDRWPYRGGRTWRERWTSQFAPGVAGVKLRGDRGSFWIDPLSDAEVDSFAAQIIRAVDRLGMPEVTMLVQFPFWAPLALRLKREAGFGLVYDCLDAHGAFTLPARALETIMAGEPALIREADLAIATSPALLEHVKPLARRAALIPNGCDAAHFAGATVDPAIAALPKPVLGYVGAIEEWFDPALVEAAAKACGGSVVLIGRHGPGVPRESLATIPNLHMLGERPYETLPALVAGFDVGLIPFRRTPLTEATDPVKFYEYLAAGLPVVSTRLPALAPLAGLARFGDTPEAFARATLEALADGVDPEARRAVARANGWRARAAALDETLRDAGPRASIVIVTWNGWEHTRACLDSVFRCMPPSRSEVIVVDNASSDGTGAALVELATRRPELRVILNQTNRGFAAATNQGLEAARGDLLVLLNNDTVVTPGWLRGLAAVLEDPRVGLVGPVSNHVGNRACVRTSYFDMDGMLQFARERQRRHAGRRFEIPMLGMFCLAMRRDAWETIGPLDEGFGVGLFEDDDYSRRARAAGLRIVCAPGVFVHHVGRASFDRLEPAAFEDLFRRNRARFEQKWGVTWTQDHGEDGEPVTPGRSAAPPAAPTSR